LARMGWQCCVLTAALPPPSDRLGENWTVTQVPRGVVVLPMYKLGAADRPLELKLQTVFGTVVGGTLHTHPWAVWVMADGALHAWKSTSCTAAAADGDGDGDGDGGGGGAEGGRAGGRAGGKQQLPPSAGWSAHSREAGIPKKWRKVSGGTVSGGTVRGLAHRTPPPAWQLAAGCDLSTCATCHSGRWI
jgi:hypothetical protein